jgi:uncharacterized protein (DUF2141 family)
MKLIHLVLAAAATSAAPAAAEGLNVDLSGVRSSGGSLYVSVQSREQFMKDGGTASTMVSSPGAGSHQFSFAVPAGEYAVSVWHDDNGNGKFDKSESHMPLDGWAMTNGAALRGDGPAVDDLRPLKIL